MLLCLYCVVLLYAQYQCYNTKKLRMTTRVKRQFLISGWLKLNITTIDNIPNDIVKLITEFYPLLIEFEGSKFNLTDDEKLHLTEYLFKYLSLRQKKGKISNLKASLLYDIDLNGASGTNWHKKVDGHYNTLTLIQEINHKHIFGCFVVDKYQSQTHKHLKDKSSFIFLLRSTIKDVECPKFIEINGEKGPYDHNTCGPCLGNTFDFAVFAYEVECYIGESNRPNYPGLKPKEFTGGERDSIRHFRYNFKIEKMQTHRIDVEIDSPY